MKQFKSLLLITAMMSVGQFASADPAICAKYEATLPEIFEKVEIVTQASDYMPGQGYLFIETRVSGFLSRTCGEFFDGNQSHVCGERVENVQLISTVDCWE